MADLYKDPIATAQEAADKLASITGKDKHDVALVMGSGWISATQALGQATHEFAATDLPGFLAPTVAGHGGVIRSYTLDGAHGKQNVLVFLGRTHLYEGKGLEPVVHGARTAVKAGCKVIVLTNACGGISLDYTVGQPVIIRDHISMTATSPLIGADFVDLTDLYSKRLRDLIKKEDPTLAEGVYAHWRGPAYETPAEIKMLRTLGADLVGMSTVPEAIAAHALGAEILGISLVTNAAAGVTGEKLSHAEVMEAGAAAAGRMGELLRKVLNNL
ncbi:MAG: purine-nucleoside phosphorylase [Actinobacteria bacterium]|nr:purine-nucleoside phosphorylase [Actinomycetota bacterium]